MAGPGMMSNQQLQYFIRYLHREGYNNILPGVRYPGTPPQHYGLAEAQAVQGVWRAPNFEGAPEDLEEELRMEVEAECIQDDTDDDAAAAPPPPDQAAPPPPDQAELPADQAAPPADQAPPPHRQRHYPNGQHHRTGHHHLTGQRHHRTRQNHHLNRGSVSALGMPIMTTLSSWLPWSTR
ncbi:uncharacterized protein LOC121400529 [Xenopus laevis]|uniref:Uncharacterized protein LOC121400529 n=1 Tax=Xenopus laevis TaxID=8355 RepID=A0A8J1MDU0_XENLA|nr:uncharacterized protein LOC121400529 [Xenopus laevis]